MKAIAKQLTNAARVLRSFHCIRKPTDAAYMVTIRVEKGEAVYLRKEKP